MKYKTIITDTQASNLIDKEGTFVSAVNFDMYDHKNTIVGEVKIEFNDPLNMVEADNLLKRLFYQEGYGYSRNFYVKYPHYDFLDEEE
jgi:hypothetical protein